MDLFKSVAPTRHWQNFVKDHDFVKWYCSELVYDIYLKQLGVVRLCKPRPISDYHLVGMDKTMRSRGISRDQLAVAPVDLFDSKQLH